MAIEPPDLIDLITREAIAAIHDEQPPCLWVPASSALVRYQLDSRSFSTEEAARHLLGSVLPNLLREAEAEMVGLTATVWRVGERLDFHLPHEGWKALRQQGLYVEVRSPDRTEARFHPVTERLMGPPQVGPAEPVAEAYRVLSSVSLGYPGRTR